MSSEQGWHPQLPSSPLVSGQIGLERREEGNQGDIAKIHLCSVMFLQRPAGIHAFTLQHRQGAQHPASRTGVSENWINPLVLQTTEAVIYPSARAWGITRRTFQDSYQGKWKSGPVSNYSQHPSFLDTIFNFLSKRACAEKIWRRSVRQKEQLPPQGGPLLIKYDLKKITSWRQKTGPHDLFQTLQSEMVV